jgi:hypothetical protein
MTVSIGAFSTGRLTAQPYGHDGEEVYKGRTARSWRVSGLLTAAEWTQLNSVYRTWRNARIADEDSAESGVVGTTVSFGGTGFGESWTNIPCWFISAPSSEQLGAYVNATCEIVDAAEKLEILLKAKEDSEKDDIPDLGTITLGSTVITLTSPPETLENLPRIEPMAGGSDYILGPLAPRNALNIQGYTDAAGWTALVPWAKAQVSSGRNAGDYWVTSAPVATAEHKIVDGVKIVRYNVNIGISVIN